MYKDGVDYCKSCVECAVVNGTGKVQRLPLHPILVQRPFQILGVDIMELPVTQQGNQYVIDFLTKWPLMYPADRGTNLLSHLMKEVCELLGITK